MGREGCGLREGSSSCTGGEGGPSKGQLGLDPHLGALDSGVSISASMVPERPSDKVAFD